MIARTGITKKVGRIRPGEVDYLWLPDEPYDGYPVVLLHGAGTLARDSFNSGAFYATSMLAGALYERNIPVMAGWMGNDTMGNDTGVNAVESARTYLDSLAFIDASKIHSFGISMGAFVGGRHASLNPTRAASFMGLMPFSDPAAVYNTNRAGFRATIGTAWGVTYPTPLPAQANFIGLHAPAMAAANIPRRLMYSTADTTVLPAEVTALAAAMGIVAEVVDAVNNHDEKTIWSAMQLGAGGWDDYADWVEAQPRP